MHLERCLDHILKPHDYPYPVAHMVAETAVLALLLSSMIKYEGIFTLQARGDGPVHMIVADVTSDGGVRACASFDEERMNISREALDALKTPEGSSHHLAQYLGKGHMAFTVQHQGSTDMYQGVVELSGASLVDCVQHYFVQSEQIQTGIKMAVGLRDGVWSGGGIMVQKMPEEGGQTRSNVEEDGWRRAMVLLDSCTEDEVIDTSLPMSDLLFRLFHEDGVRLYDAADIQKECRCDAQRVEVVVRSLPEDDREYLVQDDGLIEVVCEFCATPYKIDPKSLKSI